ncbi:hypothetical protein GCM10022243_22040 [Saccharothrix violaceirubra]
MIRTYLPTAEKADQFRTLARLSRQRSRPRKVVGARDHRYLSLERYASEIRMVYNEIPGLAQTEEYARAALLGSPTIVASTVQAVAAERAERGRNVLHANGPRVWIVLGEDALDRSSGGPEVLRRPLEHLRTLAALPNITLRVITRAAGNVAGLSAGFTLPHTDVGLAFAYITEPLKGDYVRAEDDHMTIFENSWACAASEKDSAAILEARISDRHDRQGQNECGTWRPDFRTCDGARQGGPTPATTRGAWKSRTGCGPCATARTPMRRCGFRLPH